MNMSQNILIIIGSPKNQNSNSNVIANNLESKLTTNKNLNCSKIYLAKALNNENALLENIQVSDVVILVFPIYENSTPSIVLKFFETIYENKEKLMEKNRKMFVITNSGFPEIIANKNSVITCSLFAKDMNFTWLGGITVAPGTLINGQELGKTYKRLNSALSFIAQDISNDKEISNEAFKLTSKPFMSPFIYRFAGRILQNGTIKKIGKNAFFSKPLEI